MAKTLYRRQRGSFCWSRSLLARFQVVENHQCYKYYLSLLVLWFY
ncbi:hypothetical protein [Bartonella sp. OT172YNZD]